MLGIRGRLSTVLMAAVVLSGCGQDAATGTDAVATAGASTTDVANGSGAGRAGTTPASTPTPVSTTSTATSATPSYVLATYWLGETPGQVRLRDVDPRYNVIYLFAARPLGGAPGSTGAVEWHAPSDPDAAANLVADIQSVRASGRRVLLSVGGYNQNVVLDTRSRSMAFIDSFEAIYRQMGGLDGLDWDSYEGSDSPNEAEMTWIGQQLKALHPGFLISSPPAPWSDVDIAFCRDLLAAKALNYCAPQFYDGPQHTDAAYISEKMAKWTAALGPEHVVVGFGVNPGFANYMTIDQAASVWTSLRASYPTLLGAYDWKVDTDRAQEWAFAARMAPLVSR